MICEPNPACHLLLQVKFYWNTAVSICLHIVGDCFHHNGRVKHFRRNHVAHKARKFAIWFFTEKVC